MRVSGQAGRYGAVVVIGLVAAEVLIMISPFMGFFYASLRFESVLGVLSASRWTAWLDGFFLNHAVVTDSLLLEPLSDPARVKISSACRGRCWAKARRAASAWACILKTSGKS